MATYAIGDIHGCFVALTTLIDALAPSRDDTLIFLGDYIDRGPSSCAVIDLLLRLPERTKCVFLRGNHEVMILGARADERQARMWTMAGGHQTLVSYKWEYDVHWWTLIPPAHWEFFEKTAPCHEDARHIFVHASVEPDLDLPHQPERALFWERFDHIKPHKSGKRIICGHTPDFEGEIDNKGFATCIDTGPAMGGWLTGLDVTTGNYIQANEYGSERRGSLAPK